MKRNKKDYKPMDLTRLRVKSITQRRSLVEVKDFARLAAPGCGFRQFERSLPNLLAARELRALADEIARAARRGRPVVAAIGAHVIKCGASPLLIDLMKRGVISALATHGAGAVHDYEISLAGTTSEAVAAGLPNGEFGMARETASGIATAAERGAQGAGLGRALGETILRDRNRWARYSLFATAAALKIPATVHVAVGTDVVHMHPQISGAALGEASLVDFKILCAVVGDLDGGVWLNIGSAVILPEVFLKALSAARNLGHRVEDFCSANLDMIQHYRPKTNVLLRPRGKGFAITGHHEIMLPMLRMMVLERMGKARR
jgi:hypothetical protein